MTPAGRCISDDDDEKASTIVALTFEVQGLLECILSFHDIPDLLSSALVSQRWKSASRDDSTWKHFSKRATPPSYWTKYDIHLEKYGKHHEDEQDADAFLPLFWRSLFTKSAIQRMTAQQILRILNHPLAIGRTRQPTTASDLAELQQQLQLHVFDVLTANSNTTTTTNSNNNNSTGSGKFILFSDLYFGSYVCMMRDAKRDMILPAELSIKFGFDFFFKRSDSDAVLTNMEGRIVPYEAPSGIVLSFYTVCYFRDDGTFEMDMRTYDGGELPWRWLQGGRHVQVGHYPPLVISRRSDWGWKLENAYVVLLDRNG